MKTKKTLQSKIKALKELLARREEDLAIATQPPEVHSILIRGMVESASGIAAEDITDSIVKIMWCRNVNAATGMVFPDSEIEQSEIVFCWFSFVLECKKPSATRGDEAEIDCGPFSSVAYVDSVQMKISPKGEKRFTVTCLVRKPEVFLASDIERMIQNDA